MSSDFPITITIGRVSDDGSVKPEIHATRVYPEPFRGAVSSAPANSPEPISERGRVVDRPMDLVGTAPQVWSRFIRENYRDVGHVMQVFNVSDRTARAWWNAETGVKLGYVRIAAAEKPAEVYQMLMAAE